MSTENRQITSEENSSELPSDDKLFAGQVHEQLPECEVFAGDEEFYKSLAESTRTTATQSGHAETNQLPTESIRHKRFSTIQKILITCIAAIAVIMLLYALLKSPSGPVTSWPQASSEQPAVGVRQSLLTKPPAESPLHPIQQQVQKPEPVHASGPAHPLSLEVAESLYQKRNYDKAYSAYNQLHQGLLTNSEEELLRDFLQLRMALCMKKAGNFDQANHLFRTVLQSHSPVIRATANYHLCLLEMQKKQYLKARARAYQTIGLISAVHSSKDWGPALRSNCCFLVAESITRKVLSLCDADNDLPAKLWVVTPWLDPFTGLSDTKLRSLLNSGSKQLSKGLLGPQIQKLANSNKAGLPRWSVICHSASIEELLARFAANTDLDVQWASGLNSIGIRKRPVSLYLPAATSPQFATIAAGCVGLLARFDEKGVVTIYNPANYSSLSKHVSLLTQEAISLWQKFILTFYTDERIPNAHFALGLLQAPQGKVVEAIAEYKLVANRFPHTSLAPVALLHSSKVKSNLHNYPGARDDLEQLVEQYPDTEIAEKAYLRLADATMNAGFKTEAARLYRKVYNLEFSLESQTSSALRAGRCFYEIKDFQSASKWLTRYIRLARDHSGKDIYSAYLLLGKSNLALGKTQPACDAFQCALAGQLPKEEYVETISALVKAHVKLKDFIKALDVLENIQSWQLSQKESIEILLLKSEILRTIGLADKAIAALRDRNEYTTEPQSKAKISFELAKCYITKGDLQLAQKKLTETLMTAEPGPLAHEVTLELADVCLKLGQNSQAISTCSQLLNSALPAQIKQKALHIMAAAYNQQKNYNKAALTLLGQWKETETLNKERTPDDQPTTEQSPMKAK